MPDDNCVIVRYISIITKEKWYDGHCLKFKIPLSRKVSNVNYMPEKHGLYSGKPVNDL